MASSNKVIPPGRTGHVAVTYEKYMLVWGGYFNKENPGDIANTFFNGSDLWIYSSVSDTWYLKQCHSFDIPPGMSGSTAVVIDSCLYLFGGYGYDGEGCTNQLYKLNLETFCWENLSPEGIPPTPVDKMVGWAYNKKFYIFGGFGNPDSISAFDFQFIFYNMLWRGWTNQFFAYDPKTNRWTRPESNGSLPCARAAHAVTMLQDKVYIFGGRHDSYRLNDLHCLDMETMTWSGNIAVNGPIPEGRSWHSLTSVGNQYLILYGGFSQNNVALSDCWMFDTQAEIWQQIELPYEKPRLWHSACLNAFNEVLIYGGCTSNIQDMGRKSDQANDIIVISIAPKSLFRLCMDIVSTLRILRPFWTYLPQHVQMALHMRVGNCISSNLDGS